jgi:hypothetical protein
MDISFEDIRGTGSSEESMFKTYLPVRMQKKRHPYPFLLTPEFVVSPIDKLLKDSALLSIHSEKLPSFL